MQIRSTWSIRRDLVVGFAVCFGIAFAVMIIAVMIKSLLLLGVGLIVVPIIGVFRMKNVLMELQMAKRRDAIKLRRNLGAMDADLYDGLE